jgi:hypothetical protein
MESILTSIKKMLGIEEEYTQFDQDIILDINSVLMVLMQLGVGTETGFFITDKSATWANFLGDRKDIEALKSYIYMKVRLMFDPPATSFLIEAIERQIAEFEWRINIQVDKPIETTTMVYGE